MAKITAICRNEDCEMFNQPQEVEKSEMICPECGLPVISFEGGGKTNWWKEHGKQVMIGAATVPVMAGAYFLLRGGTAESVKPSPSNITLSKNIGELVVGENDTLQAIFSPDDATAQLKWATSDTTVIKVTNGVVTAVSPGTAKVGVQVTDDKTLKAFCEYTVKKGPDKVKATVSIVPPSSTTLKVGACATLRAKVTPEGNTVSWTSSDESIASVSTDGKITALKAGSVDIIAQNIDAKDVVRFVITDNLDGGPEPLDLGYGTYTGGTRNGKPEGQGRLVYTKAHRIAKYDAEGRVAQPGESISGVFHNGEITIGKYFDAYGNLIETLNIGSAD